MPKNDADESRLHLRGGRDQPRRTGRGGPALDHGLSTSDSNTGFLVRSCSDPVRRRVRQGDQGQRHRAARSPAALGDSREAADQGEGPQARQPTPLGQAFAEYGRIAKTEHLLRVVDPVDDTYRRQVSHQLTVQESRHKPTSPPFSSATTAPSSY
ncbi:Tn3 family transposase [Streptomyces sp. NPDC048430]|uniref:Tn3 family transposase n=1 Tax=Streptomyces sp. NPDC048430 TaxID=3155388 RepID=UPI003442FD46